MLSVQLVHEDSEQLQDDWEHGITQNCSPSQIHGKPWNRSDSSLNLAIHEGEPYADIHSKLTFVGKVPLFSTLSLREEFSYEILEQLMFAPPIPYGTRLSLLV